MSDDIFDLKLACDALNIPKPIYLRILAKAIPQTITDLGDLRAAFQKNDIITVAAIAHRLKGDYANLRIDVLSVLAKQLNELTKKDYTCEKALEIIQEIEKVFFEVKTFFENIDA